MPSNFLTRALNASQSQRRPPSTNVGMAIAAAMLTTLPAFAEPPMADSDYYQPPTAKVSVAPTTPARPTPQNKIQMRKRALSDELGMQILTTPTIVGGREVNVHMQTPTGPYAYAMNLPVKLSATSESGGGTVNVEVCNDEDCDVVLHRATLPIQNDVLHSDTLQHQIGTVFPGRSELYVRVNKTPRTGYRYHRTSINRTSSEWVVAVQAPNMDVLSAGLIPSKGKSNHGFAGFRGVKFDKIFDTHPKLVHGFNVVVFEYDHVVNAALAQQLRLFVENGGIVIGGANAMPAEATSEWKTFDRTRDFIKYGSNVTVTAPTLLDAGMAMKARDGFWVRYNDRPSAVEVTAMILHLRPEMSLVRHSRLFATGPDEVAATIGVHRFNSGVAAVGSSLLWMFLAFGVFIVVRKRGWGIATLSLGIVSLGAMVFGFVGASLWRTSSEPVSVTIHSRTAGHATTQETGTSAQRTGMWASSADLHVPVATPFGVTRDVEKGEVSIARVGKESVRLRTSGENTLFAHWRRSIATNEKLSTSLIPEIDTTVRTGASFEDNTIVTNNTPNAMSFIGIAGHQGTRWKRSLAPGESVTYNQLKHISGKRYTLEMEWQGTSSKVTAARRLARDLSRQCDESRGASFDRFSCAVAVDMSGANLKGFIVSGIDMSDGSSSTGVK